MIGKPLVTIIKLGRFYPDSSGLLFLLFVNFHLNLVLVRMMSQIGKKACGNVSHEQL